MKFLFVLIGLWLLDESVVEAINCYQCNSVNNSACHKLEDKGKFIKSKPCPIESNNTEPFCRKADLWYMNFDRVDQIRTIRGCGYIPNKNNKTYYQEINDGHEEYQYVCFTDDCNGSVPITVSTITIMLPAFSMMYIFN